MKIKVFQKGIEIGAMASFVISGEEIYCSDIHLVLEEGNFFYGNEEVQIKQIDRGEEKIYNFKVDFIGYTVCFQKDINIQFLKGTILKTKVEENHAGQIYNPYNDTWSWF